jgi:hypothetical protein
VASAALGTHGSARGQYYDPNHRVAAAQPAESRPRVVEAAMAVPGAAVIAGKAVAVSADGTGVAAWEGDFELQNGGTFAVGRKDASVSVWHNGREGPAVVAAGVPVLSRDGRHCAYFAVTRDRRTVLVFDGRFYGTGLRGFAGRPAISDDGSAVAYAASVGEKQIRVFATNRDPSPVYEAFGDVAISRDGRRVAYVAKLDGVWRLVVDGAEVARYDSVGNATLSFLPDGRVVHHGVRGDAWFVQVGDAEYGPYTGTIKPAIYTTDDGRRFAFRAVEFGPAEVTSVDADRRLILGPRFVLDGKPLDYAPANREQVRFVPGTGRFAFVAMGGKVPCLSLDGELTRIEADGLDEIAFSGDGRTVAYAMKKADARWAVVDGREYGPYDTVSSIQLNRDGIRFAFAATRDGKSFVVHNGREGGRHDKTLQVALSPDGEHVAYWALLDGKARLVIDEKAGKQFDGVVPDTRIAWHDAERLTTFGFVKNTVWRLQATLNPDDPLPGEATPPARREPRPRVRM